ncbi:hypothetical protein A3A84_02485 [Candidatus Collierbacteria bacterium RIFCSPLOWO2_01_FULL_50_23]|uniref:Uncharacterized protein n=2 Tax=Candidatus Collieribacteriota TaxID=1752725 RepID=A0A1F5ETN5_9BACT|nr:MAG: hypothetical protein A3D09_00945 [Candidatus Collierbacteria bacterium RIFCSPHIGHO2_02_FULL_49_10]OGD72253.1 MAG: hypothetical protein A2703_02715 [Candidatus Collierbacteria bacterium RIFCSPHIGHO2_01_FULL_50_25]OGD73824.1 MAG: hypothetical protein A3A84_02485 [Candidatus Collierbacteria bacterium RIFCSPLOWO2_01_FULL_50_23]
MFLLVGEQKRLPFPKTNNVLKNESLSMAFWPIKKDPRGPIFFPRSISLRDSWADSARCDIDCLIGSVWLPSRILAGSVAAFAFASASPLRIVTPLVTL